MTLIGCDISEYQQPVDDSYNRPWLIFRCCDPAKVGGADSNCMANSAWCYRAVQSGKIQGWTAYCVYRPGENDTILALMSHLLVGPMGHVMVDAETWGGQITGNHSAEINALLTALGGKYGRTDAAGNPKVWLYGNSNDLATLDPSPPSWVGVVVASYGGSQPVHPQMVGWQYTDGVYTVPGLPSSSPPFGAIDHNALYLTTGGLHMDADVKAAFDAVNANISNIATLLYGNVAKPDPTHPYSLMYLSAKLDALKAQIAAVDADLKAAIDAGTLNATPAQLANAVVAAEAAALQKGTQQ